MKLTVEVDLPLRDVASQIGNRVGDVVVRHGEDGQLRDTSVAADDAAGALVDGGEIGVHVTGVSTASGDLRSEPY